MDPISPLEAVQQLETPKPTLPTVGSLLSESWEIYKEKFMLFVKLYLWTILYSLYVVVPLILLVAVGRVIDNSQVNDSFSLVAAIAAPILFLPALIYLVYIGLRLQIAEIMTVRKRTEVLAPKELLNMSAPFVRPYFWTSALLGLMILLGFIALIIPGVLLLISSCLTTYIIIDLNLKGMEAIKKSWQYTKGHYGAIGKYVLAIILIALVLQYGPELILGKEIGSMVGGILGLVTAPLFVIYGYLMYEKFKLVKPELAHEIKPEAPIVPVPPTAQV